MTDDLSVLLREIADRLRVSFVVAIGLVLQRPGFQPRVREGVRVTANRCGDNTVALRADLTPR